MRKTSKMLLMVFILLNIPNLSADTNVSEKTDATASKGLIGDSSLVIKLRNWNHNRHNTTIKQTSREWTQGIRAEFESGYTPGFFGVGLDAFLLQGIKITEKNFGIAGIPEDGNGDPKSTWGRPGVTLKAKLSKTTIKYGHHIPGLPIFEADDLRTIPESTSGIMVNSKEIDKLEINLARFDQLASMNSVSRNDKELDVALLGGGTYQIMDNFSATLYFSDIKNKFDKQYANINYTLELNEKNSVEIDFNAYHTNYDKAYYTAPDTWADGQKNTIASLAASYTYDYHTVMLAYQQNFGDSLYDYGADGDLTVWVANSQYYDYNNKKERSIQLSYTLDFKMLNLEGLKVSIGHIHGTNINGDKNLKERESYVFVNYVVPDGILKDLSFMLKHYRYRGNYEDGKNENRVKLEYPLVVF